MVDAIASLIDQDIEFVFDALDGKSHTQDSKSNGIKENEINYREEPVAFFFILYGIAFEALVKRDTTDYQGGQDQTLEILLALKRILRPPVSGRAIYQDAIFSETMDLFDRLALTEGLPVQAAVVDITRNLCLNHPSVEDSAEDNEHLSDNIEQLFELTKIIVLVLANLLPNLAEKPSAARNQLHDDAVALIVKSLEALVDAADAFPSVIRTDLHACIIHIFITILGTGVCQVLVVPKALPIFKRFIQSIAEDAEDDNAIFELLQTCLQRFRHILANAQRRESEASLQCATNILMASVILLTSGSECISPDYPSVSMFLDDLIDCLQDRGLGKVAASCARSLLITQPKSETGQFLAGYLIPRVLKFLVDDSQEDPENARDLILQTLLTFASLLGSEEAATVMCVVLPTILHRASVLGKESFRQMAGRLLSLASTNQDAFRSVVASVNLEQRALIEEILKEGGVGRDDNQRGGNIRGEPSIALKLTFGAP